MYWPRLQLTNDESKRWTIYSDPNKLQRSVDYRTYSAELNLSSSTPEDTENIQIARRARIFAITGSGDIHNVEVILFDSTGEQYTMGYHPLVNLFVGSNADPRGLTIFSEAEQRPDDIPAGLTMGKIAQTFAMAPHVFEPNIVLASNLTFSVKGRALSMEVMNPSEQIHVSLVFHVWEFPLE